MMVKKGASYIWQCVYQSLEEVTSLLHDTRRNQWNYTLTPWDKQEPLVMACKRNAADRGSALQIKIPTCKTLGGWLCR